MINCVIAQEAETICLMSPVTEGVFVVKNITLYEENGCHVASLVLIVHEFSGN
jgi:hypothetical protein